MISCLPILSFADRVTWNETDYNYVEFYGLTPNGFNGPLDITLTHKETGYVFSLCLYEINDYRAVEQMPFGEYSVEVKLVNEAEDIYCFYNDNLVVTNSTLSNSYKIAVLFANLYSDALYGNETEDEFVPPRVVEDGDNSSDDSSLVVDVPEINNPELNESETSDNNQISLPTEIPENTTENPNEDESFNDTDLSLPTDAPENGSEEPGKDEVVNDEESPLPNLEDSDKEVPQEKNEIFSDDDLLSKEDSTINTNPSEEGSQEALPDNKTSGSLWFSLIFSALLIVVAGFAVLWLKNHR